MYVYIYIDRYTYIYKYFHMPVYASLECVQTPSTNLVNKPFNFWRPGTYKPFPHPLQTPRCTLEEMPKAHETNLPNQNTAKCAYVTPNPQNPEL